MKLRRRHFQRLVAGAISLPAVAGQAGAQAWPSRPVRWIVGYAPGGGNDIVARLMGQWFADRLGQPFVVENRPGAATNIAAESVVNAVPDGYTLLLVGQPNAINATLYETLPFNFMRDIAPVAGIMTVPNVMVVHPSSRRRPSSSSSPTPRPIPTRSTWHRRATAAPPISPASCSSR